MTSTNSLKSLRSRLFHTSPLLAFGLSAAFGSGQARAGDANALPQNPNVAAGGATFSQSGQTLTVNQSSSRVVIDWRSFDIGANAQANFNQPNSSAIAVNRVNAGTDPTKIDGGLSANGQVWILNPNGVLFGSSARVNAAGIVASTANIDTGRFMAGDNRLTFTGQDSGTVANDGHISVGDSGLAAFVAPSVRNSGVITARTGKVTLAAGTTFTLDLAGDHLVEIGIASNKPVVDQAGKIVDPGGTVQLSARAASAVVDGAINMSGVIRTASARRVGGDIVLDGDNVAITGTANASGTSGGTIAVSGGTIDVSSTAALRADGHGTGNGGTITATASLRGSYAGRYSARGGAAGGDGGWIETSGESVTTAPDIAVDASAPNGTAGEWLIDPLNVTIAAGSGGSLGGATVTVGAIQTALAGGTSVSITTAQNGSDAGDLTLAATINATATGNAGLNLTGRHLLATGNSVINLAGGALTLNVNAVNANSTPPTGGWINDALGMIGTVSGGSTINLGAGTYTTTSGYINVNKSNVTINGAGQGLTILDSRTASTYGLRVTAASNVTLNGFTLYGATGTNAYGLKAEATTNLTLTNITSQGAAKSEFDLNGIIGATLNNLTANGAAAIGAAFTSGAATAGNGISLTDSQNITLANSTTLNNQWGGLALYQSNFASGYSFQEKNITVAASNNFTEANPVYAEDQSATNDFGALTLAGYNYIVQSVGSPSDVYSWFQKTQQAAINYAVNTSANATVQGYAGNGENGNNIFTIGYGTLAAGGSSALSIAAAVSAAVSGATVNILNGVYALATQLNLNKSMTLSGAGIGSTTLTSSSTGYGINVIADNVHLTGFTFNAPTAVGAATYGIKVTPDTNAASDRLLNFAIDHVRINGGYRTGLDLNGVLGATIDTVSVANVVNGNGIALTDSANVTITNTTTSNDAWGGLALYQTNNFYNQQVNNITVGAGNTFNEVIPVYAEDQSASLDFGAIALAGFNYVVKSPNLANDVYTWFQKTGQAAIDFATNAALSNNNINLPTATVQGYAGNGVQGNNIFTVGTGSNGVAMSIGTTLAAASAGATVNVMNGTYVVPPGGTSYLDITQSLTLTGQSQSGTIIDARNASAYGLRVQADNVTLSNFTLLGSQGAGGYGIKVEPLSVAPASRINNFSISNVTINGSNKNALDINGAHVALVDHVTAENAVAGNGIAVIDSSNVTITGSTTVNNAWGGLRIEEKNATYNQQTSQVVVDASNSFSEAVPIYLEDDSAGQDLGTVTVQGFGYIVRAPSNSADVYTWFQTTQQNAINYAAGLNLASATVQGWSGTAGNNHFAVGIGSLTGGTSRSLSIQAALDTAQAGAIIDVASGSYAGSLTQNTLATVNFGTVSLGGSYTLNSGAASSTLSGTLTASAVNWNAPIQLGGVLSLTTSGAVTTAAIDGSHALTINAASATLGALGATTALGAVTDLSNTTLTGGTYNAASFNFGGVTLAANTSLGATGMITVASINGNETLNINAASASLGALGAITALGAVTDLGNTTLTGGTYNAASFNFGSVTLAANTGLNTTGTISVASINGNKALTISAASATLGALGTTTALGAVTDLGATTLTGGTYNAASFNLGSVTLAANTNLNATGALSVASMDGNKALTINAASANLGALGATTALGAVTDLSNTTLTGGTYTAASFHFGNLALATDTNLTATGAVTAAAIDGSNALAINAGSASLGALGATTALGAVTDLSDTTLTGGTYNAASFNLGNVTLAADTSLNATGPISVASMDGNKALTINAASANLGTLGATTALGVVTDLNNTSLTGGTYNAVSFNFGNLTLAADTSLTASGAVTTAAIDGSRALTINAASANLGALGAATTLGAVTDLSNTTLAGGTYNAASFNLGGVTLTADTSLNATGTISAASVDGSKALTINASSANLGALGATTALGAVTDLSNTTLTGGTYNAASFNFGNLTLAADTSLATSGALSAAAIDGNHALTINAASSSLGTLGATTTLGTVTDLGSATFTGNAYNAASFNLGSVTLTADTSLVASGTISVASIDGSKALAINAGSVNLGALGATTALGAVTDLSNTTLAGGIYNAASFNLGGVTLAADTSLNASGTISVASIDGSSALTISAGSASLGALGATTALGAVTDLGSTTLTGGTYNAAGFNFGALTLAADTSLNATGTIAASSIDGNHALNMSASSVNLGALGATTALATVTDLASTTVTGGTYNAASFNFGALTLAADTGLTAAGAVNATAIDGSHALTVSAGSASLGALGATTVLGAVTDLANTILTGGTYNVASLNFAGDLTLTAAQTTLNTSQSGGDITVSGNLLGSSNGAQSVILRAGSGTGTAAQNGDILLQNVGSAALALGSMTVMGDNFGAQTVHLAGNFTSNLVGNQVFSSHTLNAGGTVQSAVGGNASGPINGGGSVGLSVSGQLSGAIGGGAITLNAGTIQGATVTGTQAMTITAGTVAGSTLSAPTVSATADSFSTNVTAGSVNLNAGSISGSTITGSSNVTISATNVTGSSLAAPTVQATATGNFSTDISANSVNLNAGSISGSTITGSSNVTISATTVATSSLAAPTVKATATGSFSTNVNAASVALNAGTVSGSTITGSSDVTINAKSVQGSSLTAPVVTATADSFNTMVAASSTANITGTDVAGNFSGGSFTVSGSNSVNASVSAVSTTVSGNTIAGTFTGNNVSLSGSTSVNATVSSNTLSVQSPSGNLQGDWSNVDTGASGTLVLNHQASIGDGNVGPSQLVVENFTLPQGSTITRRGDLVLPQDLVLGMASPANQNAPNFIVVQNVQQLGSLLSQSYSAIVIDLGAPPRKLAD